MDMKVRPSPWKTLGVLAIVLVLGAGIIFSFTFSLFLKPIKEWGWQPYVIIGIWVLLSIGLTISAFLFTYYEVFKKYVMVTRGNKKLIYYFSDVVYIDEKQYEKGRTIAFYTRQGHVRYLMGDKKDVLYKAMIANCQNRLSEEEFRIKYPQVKI